MHVLITGVAGFIGHHVAARLLSEGVRVSGVDDLNAYYDVGLKQGRLARLHGRKGFCFERLDVADAPRFHDFVQARRPDVILHCAAQAGVRYSLSRPMAYGHANLNGHLSVLEAARHLPTLRRLVYASSSSVYGASRALPFREDDPCNTPVSLYAATKRSAELMSESYARLYGLELVGLRYFTVYGPFGRPDMAAWLFSDAILRGQSINVFNGGQMQRDFTYIDDAVEATLCVMHAERAALGLGEGEGKGEGEGGHRLFNVAAGQPVTLERFIDVLETASGRRAVRDYAPMQPGDVQDTAADISRLRAATGFSPRITLEEGAPIFVKWLKSWLEERGAA